MDFKKILHTKYDDTTDALTKDPIVQKMAASMSREDPRDYVDSHNIPKHKFALTASDEYDRRGGKIQRDRDSAAVARAVLRLIKKR